MSVVVPDHDWYTAKSRELGAASRYPFATVKTCPRFYQSLSLLGEAGSTRIEEKEDKRLLKRWKKSDLWPQTKEQYTSISGSAGNPTSFGNFCPEVAFERFGYFASVLLRYGDEIDRDVWHKRLGKETPVKHDWRWAWASVKPQHYADCPLFAVLSQRKDKVSPTIKDPWYKRPIGIVILGVIITVVGGIILKLC